MNCDWVKSNITLYVYEELADDARYELEQHVARCGPCAAELDQMRQFRASMSEVPQPEPSPVLLAASRMRLQEALEETRQRRNWWAPDLSAWLRQMKFSPALAAVLLMLGFAGGAGTAWRIAAGSPAASSPSSLSSASPAAIEADIAGISAISQQPGSNQIQIKYDTLVPQKIEGSLNDQRIQQLLLFAARSNYSSGVRQDSVDLLSQKPGDQRIREALRASLLYDTNPGVRLKALEALGPYVRDDTSVRDAVLEALQNDANPGVRAEAIHLLQPCRADGSVRQVLQKLAAQDQSRFIRQQSTRVLASVPEID